MFHKNGLKAIAWVVIVAYFAVFNVSSLLAAEGRLAVNPQLFAQATPPAATEKVAPEEENALRQIYSEKIQRFEAEMNNATGTRNTLLTVAVSALFIGAGVMTGAGIVKNALNDIPAQAGEGQSNKDDAVKALDAVNGVGGGLVGIGGLSLVGYFVYTGIISGKQSKIDTLRGELDARFEPQGLTPEYLQKNESVAAVVQEMDDAKKSASTARTLNGFFSRVGMGSLLSGGFLAGLSALGQDVIKRTTIDESNKAQVTARDNGVDKAKSIGTTGFILLGVGGVCEIAAFIFGQRAKNKEKRVDELENSLLRVAERFEIQPTADGVRLMYTYKF